MLDAIPYSMSERGLPAIIERLLSMIEKEKIFKPAN